MINLLITEIGDIGTIFDIFESQQVFLQKSNRFKNIPLLHLKLEANNIKLRAKKKYPDTFKTKSTSQNCFSLKE